MVSTLKTVLIVDDCQKIRDLVSELLKSHFDVEVLTASSGNEGIQIISYKNIDLVFSDFNMEGGTGLDLYNYIKDESLNIAIVDATNTIDTVSKQVETIVLKLVT